MAQQQQQRHSNGEHGAAGAADDDDLTRVLTAGPGVVSPSLRCPELTLGSDDYDHGVDTWAVGCMLAELLTGAHIFANASNNDPQRCMQSIFAVTGLRDRAAELPASIREPAMVMPRQSKFLDPNTLTGPLPAGWTELPSTSEPGLGLLLQNLLQNFTSKHMT